MDIFYIFFIGFLHPWAFVKWKHLLFFNVWGGCMFTLNVVVLILCSIDTQGLLLTLRVWVHQLRVYDCAFCWGSSLCNLYLWCTCFFFLVWILLKFFFFNAISVLSLLLLLLFLVQYGHRICWWFLRYKWNIYREELQVCKGIQCIVLELVFQISTVQQRFFWGWCC